MKLLVNEQEVKTINDLENAMDWDVQQGRYTTIKYILESSDEWEKYSNVDASLYYEEGHPAGYEYTVHNWYNADTDCLTPYNGGLAFNKNLSKRKNLQRLVNILKDDEVELIF